MSELEKLIKQHRLSQPVRHFLKKPEERQLRYILDAYSIEYGYVPFNPVSPDDPRNNNFPTDADRIDCIMEVPFEENTLHKMMALAGTDKRVIDEKIRQFGQLDSYIKSNS